MSASENKIIEKIEQMTEASAAVGREALLTGIGDDTAVLKKLTLDTLFASDMLMDGVHFHLDQIDPKLIGRKALAVNLSDIAAMGGTPVGVTVSLAIPERCPDELPLAVMAGLLQLAEEFNVAVCGGDTNIWPHPLVIDVAIVGVVSPKGPVLRSGAQPGDHIFVTGPLGLSILGRHLTFTPRLAEASYLHANYDLTAMIDISDGLAKDLRHILQQSKCGAVLEPEKIPRNRDEQGNACTLEQALTGGEDFELCFTVSAETAAKLSEDKNYPGSGLFDIGVITRESGFRFIDGQDILWSGYEHGVKRK